MEAEAGEDDLQPSLNSTDTVQIDALLQQTSYDPARPLVIINPNAGELTFLRRWPLDNFARLADALIERFHVQIFLIGAPGDRSYTERIHALVRHMSDVKNIAGQTNLEELISLMRRSDLVITNDSGPLHLAIASGARTLSFFGPETPALYGPRGEGHIALYEGISCSPCLNAYNNKTSGCQNNVCLQQISVGSALAAAAALLNGTPDSFPEYSSTSSPLILVDKHISR
jgi:ADP-heptose:LPS heptosyltransferase